MSGSLQRLPVFDAGRQSIFVAMLCAIFAIVPVASADDTVVYDAPAPLLTPAELQELVGPIALYPDDLLAIVLPASTFPLQVVAASRFRADPASRDEEPNADWDESVVALLNYPEALALLNDDIDWTWTLGEAVIEQEEDVMRAVQAFRRDALAAGNIATDDRQTVTVTDDVIVIEPADEKVVYVPYYEPADVIVRQPRRVYYYYSTAYPVYYYPYSSRHYRDYSFFWGLSSYFTVSWSFYNLNHYDHNHHHHRYHARTYYDNHFLHTYRYRLPASEYRRVAHRGDHGYTFNGHWRPNARYYGARPVPKVHRSEKRHVREARRDIAVQRRVQRRADHRYASFTRRDAQTPSSRTVREPTRRDHAAARYERGRRFDANDDNRRRTAPDRGPTSRRSDEAPGRFAHRGHDYSGDAIAPGRNLQPTTPRQARRNEHRVSDHAVAQRGEARKARSAPKQKSGRKDGAEQVASVDKHGDRAPKRRSGNMSFTRER